jgi:P27 family predicted phage terminase small subunit
MGRRGPTPKIDSARGLDGAYTRPTPGEYTAFALKVPKSLSAAEAREWRRLVDLLTRPPLTISERDEAALEDLARCICRLREAEADVTARGLTMETPKGVVRNPSLLTAKEYRSAVQNWASKFGLTPDGRARLSLPRPTDEGDDPHGLLD